MTNNLQHDPFRLTLYHNDGCPRDDGWVTKQEIAGLIGVSAMQWDRRYARYASFGREGEDGWEEGDVKVVGRHKRLMYRAFSLLDYLSNEGIFDAPRGPRISVITCPECGRQLGDSRLFQKTTGAP